MASETLAIGDLSRQTGCNIETIRYYERIGLIPKPERRGTYRRYVQADVDRLRFVRRARGLGFA
ncbi:MerR family transcriptional regulator, partial [Acinetobacter baumannii]